MMSPWYRFPMEAVFAIASSAAGAGPSGFSFMLMNTTPSVIGPPRFDISPSAMARLGRDAPGPCTAANAGIEAAATEAAPRLHINERRDRPLLDWLLMRTS